MNVLEALSQATDLLRDETPDPKQEAELLLSFVLGTNRSYLLAHVYDGLDDSLVAVFLDSIRERRRGKPIQFITGRQDFRGLEFEVTPDVLIPRSETELVVEEALKCIHEREPTVVDLGTGSGCIAIALAVALPQARIFAIDLSEPALEIARKNAAWHAVFIHIQFLSGDLLGPIACLHFEEKIDCIVSNPTYVSERDFPSLQREVRDWEPKLALVAGNNGLAIYSRLIPEARKFLKTQGSLVMEIGFNMKDEVCGLFGSEWRIHKVREDLNGIPRVVVAQKY